MVINVDLQSMCTKGWIHKRIETVYILKKNVYILKKILSLFDKIVKYVISRL